MKRNIHPGILSVGDIAKRIMPQRNQSRNPNKRLTRPETNLVAYKSLKRLKALVDAQPDRTLEELRDLSGKPCSIMAVARALDRLGGRYKKRRSTLASRTAQT